MKPNSDYTMDRVGKKQFKNWRKNRKFSLWQQVGPIKVNGVYTNILTFGAVLFQEGKCFSPMLIFACPYYYKRLILAILPGYLSEASVYPSRVTSYLL